MCMCINFETLIARTACDARKCAKFVQKHFRDLGVISPQNCVKIVRAQLWHYFCTKNGARAQFLHNFSEPPVTQAGSVLRTISTQFSQPSAIFLKSAAVQDRDISILILNSGFKTKKRRVYFPVGLVVR